jgi:endonuclease/exonuclease/phosphatase family metal-dependent hydrolase
MSAPVRRLLHLAALGFAALPWLVVAWMDRPALAVATPLATPVATGPRQVRVMSFNIAVGGETFGQPLEQTAAVIRASGADVVGLQETVAPAKKRGGREVDNGRRLARLLGWNFVKQPNGRGILTPLKVVDTIPTGSGARLRTNDGTDILVFNVHLAPAPYQPYQLCGVPANGVAAMRTEAEAIAGARASRGTQVDALLADVRRYRRGDEPIFITGDFNEPSHEDWTSLAAEAGHCPLAVSFPSTRALSDAGFVDAYRAAHPDPVRAPGRTWTTTTRLDDPHDRHDRIDFVFVDLGATAAPTSRMVRSAQVIGESTVYADVAVSPWPSDHRAVVATVQIP